MTEGDERGLEAVCASSAFSKLRTWLRTVSGARCSASAISLVLLPWTRRRSTSSWRTTTRSPAVAARHRRDRDPERADDVPVRADRSGDDLEVNQVAVRRPEVAGSPPGLASERHRSPRLSGAGQLWRNGLAVVDSAKVSGNGSRGLVLPGDESADVVRVRGHRERTQCRLENRASIRRLRGLPSVVVFPVSEFICRISLDERPGSLSRSAPVHERCADPVPP